MSLHSVANRLCLEVPAASLRGTAAAAALPSTRDGAQCPRSGHPTLAGCGGFAGHVQITCDKPLQHLCAGESLCAQGCQPCQKNLGLPGLILGQRSERSDPSCSSSCGRCLLPASWKKDSPASSHSPLPQD